MKACVCGNEIVSKRATYCSVKCKQKAYRERKKTPNTKRCARLYIGHRCFKRIPDYATYCSQACKQEAYRVRKFDALVEAEREQGLWGE